MTVKRSDLLLFDLDGTLIDSVGDLHAAVNRLMAELGREPLALSDVRPMIGDGVGVLVARALAARPGAEVDLATAVARYVAFYEAAPTVHTTVYPGVADTLATLAGQGHRLIVCTNKPERISSVVLKAFGLDRYFAGVIGGDTFPWCKPDPRVIGAALDRFESTPANSFFIGDSEVDAACATGSGVPFLLMTYGYHRVPLAAIPCLATLDGFSDLAGFLADRGDSELG